MRLYNVHTLDQAQEVFRNHFDFEVERIHIDEARGRVLAEDIIANIDVPTFTRSTVDGYAVKASDTNGASETMPMLLDYIGQVDMGQAPSRELKSDQAMYVPTGGMVPEGADAMVMVEYTEKFSQDSIGILKQSLPLQHLVAVGADVSKGDVIAKKHQRLSARHIGVLASVGVFHIEVFKALTACVISTGDELVTTSQALEKGQVYDINTYTLKHRLHHLGIDVKETFVLKDDRNLIKDTVKSANERYDLVAISGGSSVGDKDYTADIIDELSEEDGVLIHGLAIKPGKPTIVGKANNKLILGLPGHPVSALIVLDQMVRMYLKNMVDLKPHTQRCILSQNVHAAPGKETFVMVTIEDGLARPVYGKSGMISMMSRADGYLRIKRDQEGLDQDSLVTVYLLD